ncbi:hypothetical protein [Streptosporangium longisporum]|uniref:Uncharacterized protein n=1 Tax=Streptosporangium longisporum TaxID=46187 RepID=A0ABP6L4E3_9ACTN
MNFSTTPTPTTTEANVNPSPAPQSLASEFNERVRRLTREVADLLLAEDADIEREAAYKAATTVAQQVGKRGLDAQREFLGRGLHDIASDIQMRLAEQNFEGYAQETAAMSVFLRAVAHRDEVAALVEEARERRADPEMVGGILAEYVAKVTAAQLTGPGETLAAKILQNWLEGVEWSELGAQYLIGGVPAALANRPAS